MNRVPEGLDPAVTSRELTFEADVTSITPFLKLATVNRGGADHMSFPCDEGSVLNDAVDARMLGAETRLELDSPDSPERVTRVVRNAERGCFFRQALTRPVPVTGHTLLNGRILEPQAEPDAGG